MPLKKSRIVKCHVTVISYDKHKRNNDSNIYTGKDLYFYQDGNRIRIIKPDQTICKFHRSGIKQLLIDFNSGEGIEINVNH